ncbi:phage repressor protein [Pantoea vagans]|uniref:Phage repressor protein n=1 Tax=Pantoea vagans TaxID=470934 RepID=A0AAN1NQN6_9GAMM|nr:phage repressor protein [Pantoea vagans]AVV37366.1 phage repressor protein [Pantoea vagans]
MMLIETLEGFALVDGILTAKTGDAVACVLGDYPQVEKLFSSGMTAFDSEMINGEWMEGVIVLGSVTAVVVSVCKPLRSTI